MSDEKIKRLCYIALLVLLVILLGFIGFKYVLPIILPFLLAWGIAFSVRAPSRYITRKTGISVKLVSPILAVLIIMLAFGAIAFIAVTLVTEGFSFLSSLAESGELEKIISRLFNPFEGAFGERIPGELAEQLSGALGGFISNLLSSFASFAAEGVTKIPGIMFFVLITLISTVYFCADLDNINRFALKRLPESWRSFILRFKKTSLSVALRYVRSYLIIMLITFVLMLAGFLVLRVRYALLFAVLVALLDALPLFGVGTVLVPYSIISLARGNVPLGIGLIILLLVNEVLRQIIEPKILGKNLGIHPLFTIILLYVGYSLLGFAGLLLVPLFAVALNSLIVKPKSAEVE